jgi:hypothetical protein
MPTANPTAAPTMANQMRLRSLAAPLAILADSRLALPGVALILAESIRREDHSSS